MNTFVEAVKQMDGFSHTQFLRYRSEDNYRTFLGGCTTISLILLFIGMFSTMIIDTLSKDLISGSLTKTFQLAPEPYIIEINNSNKFMLAFGVIELNMSQKKRFFDITFEQKQYANTTILLNTTVLNFVPCQRYKWDRINQNIEQAYDSLALDSLYCLQTNQKIELAGRWSSNSIKVGQIKINKCTQNNVLYPNTTCASQKDLQDHISANGGFIAMLYFINANINIQTEQFMHYYLEEKNWIHFDLTYGSYSELYLSEFNIQTDNNLVPWSDISTISGIYVQEPIAFMQRMGIVNNKYLQLNIVKSQYRYDFKRSFRKFDQTLSYIGGLYGAILILFIFLEFYSKYAYEIQFGDRIFRKNDQSSYGSEDFNFITFLGYGVFNFLSIFGVNLKWKKMRQYHECRLQSLKQLDLNLLFKKIEFFEQISSIIMESHHIMGMHLFPKKTIKESKETRKSYLIQGIIYKQLDKKSKEINIENHQHKIVFQNFINQPRYQQFFKEKVLLKQNIQTQNEKQRKKDDNKKMTSTVKSLKELKKSETQGDAMSKKIIKKIKINNNEVFSLLLTSLQWVDRQNKASHPPEEQKQTENNIRISSTQQIKLEE